MSDLSGRTTIVVGASRGLGRGVATAFAEAGAPVIAVSRTPTTFDQVSGAGTVQAEVADASDPSVAGYLLDIHAPDVVVLVAGANPLMRPLRQHTWESFSANWNSDVRVTFHWLREILLSRRPPSRVVVFSSGAAIAGSPLSGGYAGAKATQRFIANYAQGEAASQGLDITFSTLLPRPSPVTEVGRSAARAYAPLGGQTAEEYFAAMGPALTPENAGSAVVELVLADKATAAGNFMLTGAGFRKMP